MNNISNLEDQIEKELSELQQIQSLLNKFHKAPQDPHASFSDLNYSHILKEKNENIDMSISSYKDSVQTSPPKMMAKPLRRRSKSRNNSFADIKKTGKQKFRHVRNRENKENIQKTTDSRGSHSRSRHSSKLIPGSNLHKKGHVIPSNSLIRAQKKQRKRRSSAKGSGQFNMRNLQFREKENQSSQGNVTNRSAMSRNSRNSRASRNSKVSSQSRARGRSRSKNPSKNLDFGKMQKADSRGSRTRPGARKSKNGGQVYNGMRIKSKSKSANKHKMSKDHKKLQKNLTFFQMEEIVQRTGQGPLNVEKMIEVSLGPRTDRKEGFLVTIKKTKAVNLAINC